MRSRDAASVRHKLTPSAELGGSTTSGLERRGMLTIVYTAAQPTDAILGTI